MNGLKDSPEDDGIRIKGADKGKEMIILDRNNYNNKLEDNMSDLKKYKILALEPYKILLQLEEKLNRLIRKIKYQLDLMHVIQQEQLDQFQVNCTV